MNVLCRLLLLLLCAAAPAAPLPPRPANAAGGKEFAARVAAMSLAQREAAVREQFAAGNVPDKWREFAEIFLTREVAGRNRTIVLRAAPDYLSIGSDDDSVLMPLSPATAVDLAALMDCTLPTRRIVDIIYRSAAAKLAPCPLSPGPAMSTMPVFARHSEMLRSVQRQYPPGTLTAGHKKDVVLSSGLRTAPGKVAIYGWHRPGGVPIQPLYLGHAASWVDYSHGVRFVSNALTVDGQPSTVASVLRDPALAELLSDEGAFDPAGIYVPAWPAERLTPLNLDCGIEGILNTPIERRAGLPLHLVIYAAPAGNSVTETFGRRRAAGESWRFDIQHIAAQMRWARTHHNSADLAVAVVQCAEQSWPTWRRTHDPDNRRIPGIIADIRRHGTIAPDAITLSGHSAGGSFVFGYLDAVEAIPREISRLCFLDSNYAYSAEKQHDQKLAAWLRSDKANRLCVVAYHDSRALLEGKPFVSEEGGTWGRTHAMLRELPFAFTSVSAHELQRHTALAGQIHILLVENPRREVLHTRLVEWNGFIHSLFAGTPLEGRDYHFPGPRVYQGFIPQSE